jgi:ABC-type antimicrobial peptide transport system permease subunit
VWLIAPESTSDYISSLTPKRNGTMGIRQMLFNVNTDDSRLIRNLSQLKDEFDNSAIRSASLTTGLTDFLGAITRIVNIVVTCFTLLIALICMLNLYNSVMGRRLSRYHELSVLKSMGMTGNQKRKMLLLENLRLILKSIFYSGIITGVFVAAIRFVLNSRFGKMSFTLPVWMILLTVAGSVISLLLFTRLCYKDDKNTSLIDEVRTELQ